MIVLTQSQMKKLGESMRYHREAEGKTQLEVGQKLGYSSAQYISNIERGICPPSMNVLRYYKNKLTFSDADAYLEEFVCDNIRKWLK